jgi:hypothetical protein
MIFGSFYLDYDFVNIENKDVIGWGKPYSQAIVMGDVQFELGLLRDYERRGEFYKPDFYIYIRGKYENKNKFIESILINNLVVYDGKIKYSMLERVNKVWLYINTDTLEGSYQPNKEEIADIQRTGLIDHVIKIDDEDAIINANAEIIGVHFNSVPIKNNKIKILYDISIKCTTGETITINRELTGYLKLKQSYLQWGEIFWYP